MTLSILTRRIIEEKNDFIYDDCYVDTEDGFRHSKWSSFMSKRLQIARSLLTEQGVIFMIKY